MRKDYKNPLPKEITGNMMLRIGSPGSDQKYWRPAVSLYRKGLEVRIVMYPGIAEEYETSVSCNMVRLAWIIDGLDFLELCRKNSGGYVVKRPKETMH